MEPFTQAMLLTLLIFLSPAVILLFTNPKDY